MAHDFPTLHDDRKMRAIAVLAAGGSNVEASRAAGVSAAAITFWLKDEGFRAELEEMTKDARAVIVRKARSLFDGAVASVAQGIKDDPKIALQFLKDTGALSQIGRQLGMTPDSDSGTVQIVINTGVSAAVPVSEVREAVVLADRSVSESGHVNVWPSLEAIEDAAVIDADDSTSIEDNETKNID
jgi:hypothetical protein